MNGIDTEGFDQFVPFDQPSVIDDHADLAVNHARAVVITALYEGLLERKTPNMDKVMEQVAMIEKYQGSEGYFIKDKNGMNITTMLHEVLNNWSNHKRYILKGKPAQQLAETLTERLQKLIHDENEVERAAQTNCSRTTQDFWSRRETDKNQNSPPEL